VGESAEDGLGQNRVRELRVPEGDPTDPESVYYQGGALRGGGVWQGHGEQKKPAPGAVQAASGAGWPQWRAPSVALPPQGDTHGEGAPIYPF
jgi:hypothetical protein